MPFNNDIAGGNGQLVRNWIQSQNYVAGVSGWRISKNGNAEFNNGTFRGSIEVGSLTGQHFIVNNSVTGDVIDIYDTLNRLVFSIDSNGAVHSYQPAVTPGTQLQIGGALVVLNNVGGTAWPTGPNIGFSSGSASVGSLQLDAGVPSGALAQAQLSLNGNTVVNNTSIGATQFGVSGNVVQTDTGGGLGGGNLRHAGVYSGTTDAGGHLVFAHGCGFTPSGALITGAAPSVGVFPNLTFGTDGFTSTLANISFIIANTNVFYANSAVTFNAEFFK